jgi:hypothetical protein
MARNNPWMALKTHKWTGPVFVSVLLHINRPVLAAAYLAVPGSYFPINKRHINADT